MPRSKFIKPGIFVISVDPNMSLEEIQQMVATAFQGFLKHGQVGECSMWAAPEAINSYIDVEGEVLVNQILKIIGDCTKPEFVGRFTHAVVLGQIDRKTIQTISRMNPKNSFLQANNVEFLPDLARHVKYINNSEDIVFSRFEM